MANPANPDRGASSSRNIFDGQACRELTNQFRQILSTKRMNALSSQSSLLRTGSQSARHRDYSSPLPADDRGSTPTRSSSLRNIPLIPQPPTDSRSIRFRNMLHTLSSMPCKWENPGLLDEALKHVPLQQIYNEAEEESQIMEAEAQSLGPDKKAAWGYQDCVIRALMRWFKNSFFSWVNNPPCQHCGYPTVGVGMAAPTPDERAGGANQVELYKCSFEACGSFERFPRYTDAFVLLQTRKGRVGEWANCFGMLCRAMGARVRWIWNSEDHVWLEIYSVHRKRWVSVDVCEQAWDKPWLYTSGWQRKLAYCIAFSADGCMDVTRRYVRNFSKWGAERSRAPEAVLLYILDEIRALRRKDLAKQEKFKLEGEDMKEYRELQGYVAGAIAQEICKIIPEQLYNAQAQPIPPRRQAPKPDADQQKAEEARQEAERNLANRAALNAARRSPNPHNPEQPPQR
ncbi:uncharacterized protein PV09_02041 [Verruconis gallopava]|uniref:Transglutaminase-like domain-containing protein n=1 Tax=Verruconis gallopava TaxID=253628 RepID=A0A0D1Z2J6_9PEZI|nr:uncharacterized protein PV09_02041 [Verruconis gallopava]KIW07172.1 hypothetical protein PV09_02041 [Verruconis gallopava]